MKFPEGFLWGAATAATRSRAPPPRTAARRRSGTRSRTRPARSHNGDTGDVADDHYHRYARGRRAAWPTSASTLPLLARLAAGAARRARRAQPGGLDFYSRLVDELLERGIAALGHALPLGPAAAAARTPAAGRRATPPSASPSTPRVVHERARRPGRAIWTTLNEPWCSAFLGYAAGHHAPGRPGRRGGAARPAHHLLLGHGLAVEAIRAAATRTASYGHHAQPHAADPATDDPPTSTRPAASTACQPALPRPGAAAAATRPTSSRTSPVSGTGATSRTATWRRSPRRSTSSASTTTSATRSRAGPTATAAPSPLGRQRATSSPVSRGLPHDRDGLGDRRRTGSTTCSRRVAPRLPGGRRST